MMETKKKQRKAANYLGVKDNIFGLYDIENNKAYSNMIHAISGQITKPYEAIVNATLQKYKDEVIAYIRLNKFGRQHDRYVKAWISCANREFYPVTLTTKSNAVEYELMHNTLYYYKVHNE